MSRAVGAVVGVVEIAAGVILDYESYGTLGHGLIFAGVSQLLGFAASLLANPHRTPLEPIGASYTGTLEPRRIVFGELTVGGMYATPPVTTGANNDLLDLVFVGAGHQIDSYGDVYLNNLRIANADIGAVVGGGSDGIVSNNVTNNGYEGLVWFRRYDGTQLVADSLLFNAYTAWDANHIGKSLAYWAVRLAYNQTAFSTGVPNITVHLKGARLYDPRLDSTNGGSGSQRYTDPTTWTYSNNPALCLRWYLTSSLGLGEEQARMNDALFAAAANICDEQVSVPIPVVPGFTVWGSGGTVVNGVGTNFLRDLNGGQFTQSGSNWLPTVATYILGPDSAMHQVASVQSDTSLTLSSTYAGASSADFISQWSNSTATTTLQSRYTCSGTLDATARFEDNIATLSRAMMGQCIYSGGQWLPYAGAWTGSAFSLDDDDVVGGVSIQCATPRQNLYNAVRGNYVSAAKNYQPDEFPAILNNTYSTADGETIYTETNFPCCTDVFEAQRNAMIVSRVSRNQKVVTAEYGMSAFGVRVWDTGTVTITEIGWDQQTVRCIGWKFTPRGTVQLQLQEAYSADWTDPSPSNYVVAGTNATAAAGLYLPYPPTGLVTTPIATGIQFNITLPLQLAPGTQIQLLEGTAISPSSSATLIWQGSSTNFTLPKSDTVTRYYWARTLGPNGQLSAVYPSGNGVAGAAGSAGAVAWIAPAGGYNVSDESIYHYGAAGYTAAARTVAGFSTCSIGAKINDPSFTNCVFGLATAAHAAAVATYAGSTVYTLIDYGWDANCTGAGGDGQWHILEAGTDQGAFGAINGTQDFPVATYDGSTIRYYLNNMATVVRSVSAPGLTLYGIAAIDENGAGLNTVSFSPSINPQQIDSGQIDSNAILTRHVSPNAIRGDLGNISPKGSIAPGSSNLRITYSSTTSSITVIWDGGTSGSAFTIYRSDGTTTSVAAGSQTVTGLSALTTYNFAIYYDENAAAVGFVTGASSSTGTPAIAYTSKSADATAGLALNGHYTLGWFTGSTTSSGGGGGGGGSGCCLNGEQLIELAGGKTIRARELVLEDLLTCPAGAVAVAKLRIEPWAEWFRVTLSNGAELLVAGDHRFIDPAGEELRARELRLQQVVEARGGYVCVARLESVWRAGEKISIEVAEPHTYYVQGVLSHNKNLC